MHQTAAEAGSAGWVADAAREAAPPPALRPVWRVAVMHAEPLVALGLAAALAPVEGLVVQVHGEVPEPHGPPVDVIVADHDSGLRLACGARAPAGLRPWTDARLLIVDTHQRTHEVRCALEMGVYGYLSQGCTVAEFVRAVRTVAGGVRYLSAEVAQCMAESLTHTALTAREAEVLALLAAGHCNKAIGSQLDIALGTVKAHVKAVMGKLGAESRTQAVSVALQRGLVAVAPAAPPSHLALRPVARRTRPVVALPPHQALPLQGGLAIG